MGEAIRGWGRLQEDGGGCKMDEAPIGWRGSSGGHATVRNTINY